MESKPSSDEESTAILGTYAVEKPGFAMLHKKFQLNISNDELIFTKDSEGKEIRRRVKISLLAGLSKKLKTSSKSLVIHIYGGEDEFLYTSDRDDIIDLVKRLYAYSKRKNLPIFAPAERSIGDYCTTKEEAEKGLTRMPDKKYAIEAENIFTEYDEDPEASEASEAKFDEIPNRSTSRYDPEMMKRYDNPDYLEKEQKHLKQEKAKKIMTSKIARKLLKKDYNEVDEVREYKYQQAVNMPHKTQLKKWVSDEPTKPKDPESADLGSNEYRKNRKKARDDVGIADKKASPDKNLVDYEEEKIEIVYEEVDDVDEAPVCRTDVSLDDFRVRKVIDKGSFGEVFLTEHLTDGKKYAMKRIKKAILTDKSLKESTENEKEILMNLNHPFLLTMSYLIENDKRYYFFLEYISGGNMYKNMFKVKRFEEEAVKFYTAQLALGLGYLHENNLVHRDLKLENVLMDKDGYIKLCDFGLAKLLNCSNDITYTFCGTTEYLAPEIITGSGHNYSVDWWTLGIICYELCCGKTPFFHRNPHMVTKLIVKGKLVFPDPVRHKIKMSDDMKDFITMLLQKDPEKRLGNSGNSEVLDHPWFSNVKWDSLKKRKIKPPYYPETS